MIQNTIICISHQNSEKSTAWEWTELEIVTWAQAPNQLLFWLSWVDPLITLNASILIHKTGITPTSEGGCEYEITTQNSQCGASHKVRDQ